MHLRRRLTTFALSATLLTGTAVALAPSASAVGSSACSVNTTDHDAYVSSNAVNFRTGPGTSYSSKGLLYKYDWIRTLCTTVKKDGSWYYAKLTRRSKSGLPANTYGWIRADMFRF